MGKYRAPEFETPAEPKFRSCASNFEARGNPWMTPRQAEKEFPQERRRVVTEHEITPKELLRNKLAAVRNQTILPKIERVSSFDVLEVPCENPDIDRWTKASSAPARKVVSTPERRDTRDALACKLAGIGRMAHKKINSRKVKV